MSDKNYDKYMPIIPLRGLTVFPDMLLSFDAGRDRTLNAINEAAERDQLCFLITQKDAQLGEVTPQDLYEVGTVARIKQVLRLQGESVRVFAEGIARGRIDRYIRHVPYFEGMILTQPTALMQDDLLREAMARKLREAFEEYGHASGKVGSEFVLSALADEQVGKLCDAIAAGVLNHFEDKQAILEEFDEEARARKLLAILRRETEIMKLEARIQGEVRKNTERSQKEYYLREQMRVIRKELGEDVDGSDELESLRERLLAKALPEEARKKADKELARYAQLPQGSHELPGLQSYLELLADLPWGEETEDNYDLANARKVLDDEHYGLEKVKDRVVEHLAVCKLKNSPGGTILCLVGPPGVGKTSIAKSVAHATGRKFVRMSLGGVHDEADIRGHRRTYIGAAPGRIIAAMREAGSMNPVLLFDEIDKLGSDVRGDPASALLEVFDVNQNSAFRDHFLELPFDLSQVMFITTANDRSTIPRPLLDRMEVIELESYTSEEKLQIARRHLLPKQVASHGLAPKSVAVPDESLWLLIEEYTREAGVRELERRLGDLCRKAAVAAVSEGKRRSVMTPRQVSRLLGPPKYKKKEQQKGDRVGVVNGMAWTAVGGCLLEVEVAVVNGKGNLELTGSLGDVMKESAHAAFTYLRTHAAEWGIDPLFYEKFDLHIHIPEGAVPKDGPSAGVTMATAMASALSGAPVRGNVAMTGEVSIRGRVLAVGGLKEKTLAAYREGITTIVLPAENQPDLPELSETVRQNVRLVFAQDLSEVFAAALLPADEKQAPARKAQVPVNLPSAAVCRTC